MEENFSIQEETGLADELTNFIRYIPATRGQRFLNWLVDNLLMRFALTQLTVYIVVYILKTFFPDYLFHLSQDQNSFDLILLSYLIGIFNYIVYYTFSEKIFGGYTLGKLLTGTRAIREDGEELTFKDALLRSLSRLVPFEAFSGFGQKPWHDSWTRTQVIKTR
jgi:uncharacterized RDD family membrane protein YckC